MSELIALGISHKTAPVELRERLALTDGGAERFLRELAASPAVQEAVAISTCNRTEIYLVAGNAVEGETAALGMLAQRAGIRPTELADVIYSPRNCDAARHLYRVTAGLESMIVGEAEVQGQVRRAYETALEGGFTGPLTNRLFHAALNAGKRVRTETAIGEARVSVASVAVDLARDVLGDLAGRNVVVIGAGETSELVARSLADRGVTTIFVANRRRERATALARRFGGESVGFDHLPERLEAADIVVSSTASPHAIVGEEELDLVMRARDRRPLLLIDIAVPRDIDPACADLDGVALYDVDDLQAVVKRNLSVRKAEARRAETVIEEEIQRFAGWLGAHEVMPTLQALRLRGAEIVERVLAENDGRWESLSERDRERVEAVARAVMNRLLHEPTLRMKQESDRSHLRIQVLRELFGLEEPSPPLEDAPAEPAREPGRGNVHRLPRRRRSA